MTKVTLLDGVRTPFGKFKGGLSQLTAKELGTHVISELIRRFPESSQSDGVILGQVVQAGQGQNPARQVATASGVSLHTPAITLNNVCLASLSAVSDAARRIEREEGQMFIVGGFESMSNAPHVAPLRNDFRTGSIEFKDSLIHDGLWCSIGDVSMGGLSEETNRKLNINRDEQDKYAEISQKRAIKAQEEGRFAKEIIEITTGHSFVKHDECLRPDTSLASLQKLHPAFSSDGSITAGNASQMADGASGGLITSVDTCEKLGQSPLAYLIDWVTVAGPDVSLHLQPANAIRALLERTGLNLSDIDLFEINEAFAGVVVASLQDLGLPTDVVNVNGGAIALGHPLGASGFRLLLTLAIELKRIGGGRGIAALCGGGGQGKAVLIEVKR